MKLTRALFLSSKKQAESWEYREGGIFHPKRYRYLVDDRYDGGNIRLLVFCVHQEPEKGTTRTQDIVAKEPHVDETFADMGRLINFLHRFQIDSEQSWQPVEE